MADYFTGEVTITRTPTPVVVAQPVWTGAVTRQVVSTWITAILRLITKDVSL